MKKKNLSFFLKSTFNVKLKSITRSRKLKMETTMTTIDLSGKSTSELVAMYNAKAELMDRPPVKRFADRQTAEKRVNQIMNAVSGVAGKSSGAAAPEVKEVKKEEAKEPVKEQPKPASTKAPAKPTTTKASAAPKPAAKKREEGELVGKGSYRDSLLKCLNANLGKQVPISRLMEAVYGQSRKDFKGPLMMVMKGLKVVLATHKTGTEIRKTRENKENHFGLYKKGA